MEAEFEALIKKIEIKSLVSLDKGVRLILDFSGEDPEIIDRLNRLMKADEFVRVQISNERDVKT